MAARASKRRPKFPLTIHRTNQYCKRIRGHLYCFGTDKTLAHKGHLREAGDLHRGRVRGASVRGGELTVKNLANQFLGHQHERMLAGDVSSVHFGDCQSILKRFVGRVGRHILVDQIGSDVLHSYRARLMKRYAPWTVNRHVSVIKAM